MKITSSRITTLLTIGENLNIEFKRAGNGPKADTFESVCAFLNKAGNLRNLYHYVKIYSNAEPVFDEDDVFRLIVPLDDAYSADRAFTSKLPQAKNAQESAATGQKVNDRVNEKVNERQRSIISSVSSNLYITQAELATMLGISIVHVNKNMKKLQALGIIRRVGPDKGGHWEVVV